MVAYFWWDGTVKSKHKKHDTTAITHTHISGVSNSNPYAGRVFETPAIDATTTQTNIPKPILASIAMLQKVIFVPGRSFS